MSNQINLGATICRNDCPCVAKTVEWNVALATRVGMPVNKKSKELAVSLGQPRNTRMSAPRRAALIVAIVLGLLAHYNDRLEASQAGPGASNNPGPSNNEPSPNGSGNLSRKLDRDNGVISPPRQVDPGMSIKPPSDAGSMRIIPPPGSEGRQPNVQPK
jgi:hypothetical protein